MSPEQEAEQFLEKEGTSVLQPSKLTKEDVQHTNIIAWIIENKMQTENEHLFDFDDHRFMIQPYTDMSPEQWWAKCAQVGGTDANMMKSAYMAIHYDLNVIYVLPSRSVTEGFVKPKVDKLYQKNPAIMKHLVTDTKNLKGLNNSFVYFRGAFSENEAIGIQADAVMGDEYDRSNAKVLKIYRSRLDASKWRLYWMFSNPSIPGFGVDEGFQKSDQMHWMVTCPHCSHEWFMDYTYDKTERNHYVYIISREPGNEQGFYACGNCHKEISDQARKSGRWLAKYPERKIRGYWFSQVFMPWIPASKIIADDGEDQAFFHNFTLGKAYVNSDSKITREMIIRNYVRGKGNPGQRFLGIDTGKDMHWMLGDDEGAIAWGHTRDWDEIERIIVSNQALTVFDPNPNPRMPLQLVEKYPGLVYLNYYVEDTKTSNISNWSNQKNQMRKNTINTDRTRAFDRQLYKLSVQDTMYKNENQAELEEVIQHWDNISRVIEENPRGGARAVWRRPVGKADHLAHANIYMEIAREHGKGLAGTGIVRAPQNPYSSYVNNQKRILTPGEEKGTIEVDIDPLAIARKANKGGKKWG